MPGPIPANSGLPVFLDHVPSRARLKKIATGEQGIRWRHFSEWNFVGIRARTTKCLFFQRNTKRETGRTRKESAMRGRPWKRPEHPITSDRLPGFLQ
jgi:hypothetical protein